MKDFGDYNDALRNVSFSLLVEDVQNALHPGVQNAFFYVLVCEVSLRGTVVSRVPLGR